MSRERKKGEEGRRRSRKRIVRSTTGFMTRKSSRGLSFRRQTTRVLTSAASRRNSCVELNDTFCFDSIRFIFGWSCMRGMKRYTALKQHLAKSFLEFTTCSVDGLVPAEISHDMRCELLYRVIQKVIAKLNLNRRVKIEQLLIRNLCSPK